MSCTRTQNSAPDGFRASDPSIPCLKLSHCAPELKIQLNIGRNRFPDVVIPPDRWQSKTLLTTNEGESKITRKCF